MKTVENNASVKEFVSTIKNERRRRDSEVLVKMMRSITGKRPKMWGPSIIGFDKYQYRYADGRLGEMCLLGFSPRVQALAFYVSHNFPGAEELFAQLGKHKFGQGGCLYINKLDDVDLGILEKIIAEGYRHRLSLQQSPGPASC